MRPTAEGIRWALAHVPDRLAREDASRPQFGHVALKCADLAAQRAFYGEMFGFLLEDSGTDYAVFGQRRADHPFIVLETGGEVILPTRDGPFPERAHPFFMSFMTPHIQEVADFCRECRIPHLREVTQHEDWGGTDMMITDADGNAIQVVQYGL